MIEPTSAWTYLPKRQIRRKRTVSTSAQVRAYVEGVMALPTALVDGLGRPRRAHLFVNGVVGELWICPASDDDDPSAYCLAPAPHDRWDSSRSLTVAGLYDSLGFTSEVKPIRGDWVVDDDKVIVQFFADAPGESP